MKYCLQLCSHSGFTDATTCSEDEKNQAKKCRTCRSRRIRQAEAVISQDTLQVYHHEFPLGIPVSPLAEIAQNWVVDLRIPACLVVAVLEELPDWQHGLHKVSSLALLFFDDVRDEEADGALWVAGLVELARKEVCNQGSFYLHFEVIVATTLSKLLENCSVPAFLGFQVTHLAGRRFAESVRPSSQAPLAKRRPHRSPVRLRVDDKGRSIDVQKEATC